MNNTSRKLGFGLVEFLVAIAILGVLILIGWLGYSKLVAKPAAPTTSTRTASHTDLYAGWKTYSFKSLALTFKYPSNWTVSAFDATCTGAVIIGVEPSAADLTAANSSMGTSMKQYQVGFYQYGTQSTKCAPDGTDHQGQWDYIKSTDKLSAGVFNGKSLTFIGNSFGKHIAKPDFGLLTNASYDGSVLTLSEPGTVLLNGKTFAVTVQDSTTPKGSQYDDFVQLDLNAFKATDLYKKTLAIFNSVQ